MRDTLIVVTLATLALLAGLALRFGWRLTVAGPSVPPQTTYHAADTESLAVRFSVDKEDALLT